MVNPYVTDWGMIRRIERAARRGVSIRLFVPANGNNWACAAAQQFHHGKLLDAGVRIIEHPAMLHAKAFVRDGEEVLAGTCNLEAWSLKRFFEIDLQLRSTALASQFEERFCVPAEAVSAPGPTAHGHEGACEGNAFCCTRAAALTAQTLPITTGWSGSVSRTDQRRPACSPRITRFST